MKDEGRRKSWSFVARCSDWSDCSGFWDPLWFCRGANGGWVCNVDFAARSASGALER
jgi:hypothetical protein